MLGNGRYWGRLEGFCQVTAQLPYETGTFHYRVRGESESFERVVAEADLATISAMP